MMTMNAFLVSLCPIEFYMYDEKNDISGKLKHFCHVIISSVNSYLQKLRNKLLPHKAKHFIYFFLAKPLYYSYLSLFNGLLVKNDVVNVQQASNLHHVPVKNTLSYSMSQIVSASDGAQTQLLQNIQCYRPIRTCSYSLSAVSLCFRVLRASLIIDSPDTFFD